MQCAPNGSQKHTNNGKNSLFKEKTAGLYICVLILLPSINTQTSLCSDYFVGKFWLLSLIFIEIVKQCNKKDQFFKVCIPVFIKEDYLNWCTSFNCFLSIMGISLAKSKGFFKGGSIGKVKVNNLVLTISGFTGEYYVLFRLF